MWYFAWILGVAAALSLGIINVMWYEAQGDFIPDDNQDAQDHDVQPPPSAGK